MSLPSDPQESIIRSHLQGLAQFALSLGASEAKAIASAEIMVEDRLANLCLEPQCENYGLAPSCPPHVTGPSGFRELRKTLRHAIVVRLMVPSSALLSCERREAGRFLHELVAGVEQQAKRLGYPGSKAFAGGSCKELFCYDEPACSVLAGNHACRYPQNARPSMSGFGINVFHLVESCGWATNLNTGEADEDADAMSWLAGLIMVGEEETVEHRNQVDS